MPGHDGGAKPRQEFAGGAAQDGTRDTGCDGFGRAGLGAPPTGCWSARPRYSALSRCVANLSRLHSSTRRTLCAILGEPDIYLVGVPAAAFSACTAQSARLRTAGTICSPGSDARADSLWPCDLRRLPRCSEPGYATGGSSHPASPPNHISSVPTSPGATLTARCS